MKIYAPSYQKLFIFFMTL